MVKQAVNWFARQFLVNTMKPILAKMAQNEKKLEQRTESENLLRRKHEQLHADHEEVTKLAEKRLADGQLAENKFNEKLNKLEGDLLSTRTSLQRTKAANQVTLKALEEEKGKLQVSL